MRPRRIAEAAVGSLLADLLRFLIRRFGLRVLLFLLGLVALAVHWVRMQPTWLQLLAVCVVAALVLRPWRWDRQRPVAPPAPLNDQVTFLYRWTDAEGRLLYVGISNDLARRTGQHIADKPWMVEAVQCVATSYPNRQAALEAEEHAIYREAPLHNVIHNRSAW